MARPSVVVCPDDGKTPLKPNPYLITEIEKFTDASRDKILMVGDTVTDIKFA